MLRPLPVDLEELASILEGDPAHGDRRLDLRTGSGSPTSRIAHMMEILAGTSGDVDAVVAVLSRDRSSPYQYVRIAERYRAAARFTDGLDWAVRGTEQ
jgi:hypothetical protein